MGLAKGNRYDDDPGNEFRRSDDYSVGTVPIWVKAITFFGVPSSIAMYLVYMMAGTHATDVKTTNELLNAHIKLSTAIEQRQEQQAETLRRVLIALCVNSAKDESQRSRCVEF